MTCPDSAQGIVNGINQLNYNMSLVTPGPAALVAAGAHAKGTGTSYDPGLVSFYQASGVSSAFNMGIGQILANRGMHVAGNLTGLADPAYNAVNSGLDSNPTGGAGSCGDGDGSGGDGSGGDGSGGDGGGGSGSGGGGGGSGGGGGGSGGRDGGGGGGGGSNNWIDPLVIDLNGDGVQLTNLIGSSRLLKKAMARR